MTKYLFAYNAFCAALWSYLFCLTIHSMLLTHLTYSETAIYVWNRVNSILIIVQSAAILEIFHAIFGVVRSPFLSTLLQVSSRLWIVYMILILAPPSRAHAGFLLMLTSWCVIEIVRYTYYAWNQIQQVPKWLFFLRYHLFMLLYPSGVFGEILCMSHSLQFFQNHYRIQLPNTFNLAISMHTTIILILLTYTPGLCIMYRHMLIQRSRAYLKQKVQ